MKRLKYCKILSGKLLITILLSFTAGSGFLFSQHSLTFALMADLHVNPGSASDSSLHELIEEINSSSFDFTIVAGDLTNRGSDQELLAVKDALDKLKGPYYVLPGNHETNWSESAGLFFNRLWGGDRFLFRYNGFLIAGFNTGPYMKMGDGHVKQEDIEWLKRSLKEQKLDSDILIAVSHYPLAEGLDNWYDVTDVLNSYDCRAVFCGHGHRLSLHNFDGIPGIMGRTALAGNNEGPGYTIVMLRNDSVIVRSKQLSAKPGHDAIALNYLDPEYPETVRLSPRPDFSVNRQYKNVSVIAEFSDTASIFTGPCNLNDSLLVYGNSMGLVKAISTRTGKLRWQYQTAGPVYSTPVFTAGVIILGTIDGFILGLDPLNGNKLWEIRTGRPVLAEGIADGEHVYIGGGDHAFYKINVSTGKVTWKYDGVSGLIQGKPALSGTSVVFGAWDRHLYCLDINTGLLKWKWNNGKPQELYSPGNITPACSGGKVFIVAPDRFMTSIDLESGKELWRTGRHMVRESMGVSNDGSLIYAKLMNDTIIAVSASGRGVITEWAESAGFGYEHNPCPLLVNCNELIASTRNGVVIAVNSLTGEVIWKYKAGNSSVNKVIAGSDHTYWFTLTGGSITGLRTIK